MGEPLDATIRLAPPELVRRWESYDSATDSERASLVEGFSAWESGLPPDQLVNARAEAFGRIMTTAAQELAATLTAIEGTETTVKTAAVMLSAVLEKYATSWRGAGMKDSRDLVRTWPIRETYKAVVAFRDALANAAKGESTEGAGRRRFRFWRRRSPT